MNEEIKKARKEYRDMILGDFKTVEEQQEWVGQKLGEAYLQGAKAVIDEVKKFNKRNAFLRQEPTTRSVTDLEEKLAQQFIDSLEKGENK